MNGTTLNYRLDGPVGAPAIALCNSLGADLHMWDRLVPALAARHRVLRHDARGHGRSALTPGPYTVELLAKDLAALVEAVGLTRPHVCGLSLGGMVALELAAATPSLVSSLVLCNTAACMPRPEIYEERIDEVRAGGLSQVVDAILAVWFTSQFRDDHPEEVERARAMILSTSPEGYAAACAAVRDADLRPVLAGVLAPALVVAGNADTATPPSAAVLLARSIPGARYLELPVAHLSALEAGPALAWNIVTFLEGTGAGGRPSGLGASSFTGGNHG